VEKLLFLGSSCIYPKHAPQPIKEEYILTGTLEPTNEPYAIAKIAGIKMCEAYRSQYGCNFISVMPTNLYGMHDNYDLESAHVLPALIHKFHYAKLNNLTHVEIWGSGKPLREFLYADDMADACYFLMQNYNDAEFLNIGTGEDISIRDLATLVSQVVDYNGEMIFNEDKPDGTYRKLLDVHKLHSMGWKHNVSLEEGIIMTYADFIKRY
jgi:GDP-L-fucose synthase